MERSTLIGNSPATLQLIDLAKRVANCRIPVLLVGPPGSEFEIVGEFIHQHSDQFQLPFARQRCISWENPADSQAWSGTGTLLVEGIEHASLPLQVQLLREVEKVGSSLHNHASGPRIIASTSRDLSELVVSGLFLEDLYWQFAAVTIPIPSLGERLSDIALLAEDLLLRFSETHSLPVQVRLAETAIQQLQAYSWPGNYRELYSRLLGAVLLATQPELSLNLEGKGSTNQSGQHESGEPQIAPTTKFDTQDFPKLVQAVVQRGIVEADRNHRELHQFIVDHIESALISAILLECEHIQTKTATRLGINRNTLHKKMKDFGLDPGAGEK